MSELRHPLHRFLPDMRYVLPLLALIMLTGCDALPKDPDGTLSKISREQRFTVGIVEGSPTLPMVSRFLNEVEKRSHARATTSSGSAESLLAAVRKGDLDLVIGAFEGDSPWQDEVAFAPPLARSGTMEIHAVARNGENRWIMLIERASRAVSAEARNP